MLELDRVTKTFGARRALDGVSLCVERGEMLALLGPNGAGKSTLFASILGLVRLSGGDVRVDGVSVRQAPRRARAAIGSVLAPGFYEYLSGWDNLRALTSYSAPIADSEIHAAVRLVGLAERIHDRVRAYSEGMRRRLAFAQALLPRPSVLLVDEWEAGLDPEGVREMQKLMVHLNRRHGTTIVVSSHHPAGVESMCGRVAILHQGRLVFTGRLRDLDASDGPTVRLEVDDWQRAAPELTALGARLDGDRAALPSGCDVADVVAALVRARIQVRAVEPVRATAEELFLRAVATPQPRSAEGALPRA